MAHPTQFAVLQKELVSPSADQLKRAFKSFSNLTDADAVRLSVTARGILMRGLGMDAARALQSALQTEGVGAAVVAESELPRLPDARLLQRVGLSPEAFSIFDLLERPTAIAWREIALVAAASVRHFEVSTFQTERTAMSFSLMGGFGTKKVQEKGHKVQSGSVLLLELLLGDGSTRYQIDGSRFLFNSVLDSPEMTVDEKFVWLVREISHHATEAVLNHGARSVADGAAAIPNYANRQALADETVWLLWHRNAAANTASA